MSFPSYAAYKDSGVPWLGKVPEHWQVVQTKRQFSRRKQVNAGMLCEDRFALTMKGVVPRSLDDLDGLQSSDYEGYQIFEAGDLAFKLIDLQNIKTSRVGMVPSRGIMSPAYVRLEPASRMMGRFGYWYFMALYWLQVFNNLGGGVRQTLGPEELLTVPLPLPPEGEQAAITAFLDNETAKIDALVAEQEQLIALLKEKRQAVISHAVTKGFNPNAPMKDSGIEWLGEIPAHWEVKKGSRIGTLFSTEQIPEDRVGAEGALPFLKVASLSTEGMVIENWNWFVEDTQVRQSPPSEFIVFPKRGAAIFGNKVNVVHRPALIDPNLMGWEIDKNVNTVFIAFALKARCIADLADVSTVPQINNKHIAPERFPIPPRAEQSEIVLFLNDILGQYVNLIGEAQSAITLLQERRAALISAAVTGKIDVRGLVEPVRERELA